VRFESSDDALALLRVKVVREFPYGPTRFGFSLATTSITSTRPVIHHGHLPLKFEVFKGSTELTDTSVITGFTQQKVTCGTGGGIEDPIEVTTTGETSLRYDTGAGQFIQNWKTPKLPGACYQVTMTTADSSALTALFKLK
jgi:hypothetical protein